MKQSKVMSLVETGLSTLIGFVVALAAQVVVFPLFGFHPALSENLAITLIFTAVSIARQFILRRVFEALHIRRPLSPAMQAVISERRRQIEVEGWDVAHDDKHTIGELARAGAGYALQAEIWELFPTSAAAHPPFVPSMWPWSRGWWKPQSFRRDLVRAGALILAELERFDRNRKPRIAPPEKTWGIRKGGINPTPAYDVPRPAPPPFKPMCASDLDEIQPATAPNYPNLPTAST